MCKINNQEDFNKLVNKLEQQQAKNPTGYQRKVIALALLGDLYLWFVVLCVVLVFLLTLALVIYVHPLWLKLFMVVAPITWVVIRSLFDSEKSEPEGVEITAKDAPALFAMIDELQHQLDTPEFHHVFIMDNLNAGVSQVPKFGMFGGYENRLIIGLPLLQTLTPQQLKAVLAHEFGHLSKSHSKLSNWAYRQRLRFYKILDSFEERHLAGDFIVRPFLQWYIPYFTAYSFPLARANEYEADRISAQLTNPQILAQALISTEIISNYEAQFWQEVSQKFKDSAKPNILPYQEFATRFRQEINVDNSKLWLENALNYQTNTDDTHPALIDRLSALGCSFEFTLADLQSTEIKADSLLGQCLPRLITNFDKQWQTAVANDWQVAHDNYQQDKQNLQQLEKRYHANEQLTFEEQIDRLLLLEKLEQANNELLIENFTQLSQQNENNPLICFHLGRLLLIENDKKGIDFLKQAIELDNEALLSASELLRDFYWKNEQKQEANYWHEQLENCQQQLYENYLKENQIFYNDNYGKHSLTAEQWQQLVSELKAIKEIKSAYLVKRLAKDDTPEIHLLAYKIFGVLQLYRESKVMAVSEKIEDIINKMGLDIKIINFDDYQDDVFYKKIKKVKKARVR